MEVVVGEACGGTDVIGLSLSRGLKYPVLWELETLLVGCWRKRAKDAKNRS